jgi:hypothetical protein
MSTILDTVVTYEDKLIDFVKSSKDPVQDTVAKGVALVGDRLPEFTYPSTLATPLQVVESQVAFAKKLIDANAAVVTAVIKTVNPLLGIPAKAKTVKAAQAAA